MSIRTILTVGALLAAATPAWADSPLVGTYELTGRQGRRSTQATLTVEQTPDGLRFTRSTATGAPWTGLGAGDGRRGFVLYTPEVPANRAGLAGALAGGGADATAPSKNILYATYRLSSSGRLTENVVNETRHAPLDGFQTIRTSGERAAAVTVTLDSPEITTFREAMQDARLDSGTGGRTVNGREAREALAGLSAAGIDETKLRAAYQELDRSPFIDTGARNAFRELFKTLPTPRGDYSPEFDDMLDAALSSGGTVDKPEARQLRRQVIEELADSSDPATTAQTYAGAFEYLLTQASDVSTERYTVAVGTEMRERRRYRLAADALHAYLRANQSSLSPLLRNIDLDVPFEVGTTMQRGVWMSFEFHDRSLFYETKDAAEALFETVPELMVFGKIYV